MIGYAKMEREEQTQALARFVPKINNWAICDCSCITYKFMRKDSAYWFAFLERYLSSEREYEIRFALVSMLDHFVTEDYIDRLLDICNHLDSDAYYVQMAAAGQSLSAM